MPYTPVTTLIAPSRGGDPDNFPGEAAVYLGALATYAPGVQALTTYLNALPLRLYQWGLLVQTNPTLPAALAAFPARSPAGDTGAVRTAKRDAFLFSSETLSTRQNEVGTCLDALSVISEAGGVFQADASRPVLPTVTAAPLRGDSPATFESKDQAFFNSLATHNDNLLALPAYYHALLTVSEDRSLITTAVTTTDDFGLITEAANG